MGDVRTYNRMVQEPKLAAKLAVLLETRGRAEQTQGSKAPPLQRT